MSIASKGSAFRISALDGRLGASDLSGELEFVPREGHQRIRGQLSSRHVQLADLFRATQASKGKTNKTSRPSGRVFSNAPFGIKIPESLQAEVTYRAERLTGPGFALDNLSTQVLVDRGVLSLNDFAARLHGATLTGQGTFNTAGDPPTHAATVDG